MKKFRGWLFILVGVGYIITVFAIANGFTQEKSFLIKLFLGIIALGLGIWMVSSSKSDNSNLTGKDK